MRERPSTRLKLPPFINYYQFSFGCRCNHPPDGDIMQTYGWERPPELIKSSQHFAVSEIFEKIEGKVLRLKMDFTGWHHLISMQHAISFLLDLILMAIERVGWQSSRVMESRELWSWLFSTTTVLVSTCASKKSAISHAFAAPMSMTIGL